MATSQSTTDKKTALQKEIAALQEKMKLIDSEAIHELKLKIGDAKRVWEDLVKELEQLTGKPATPTPKMRRERRPSISDASLKDQLLKVMATFGKEGMNAKQIAGKLNVDPIRVRKFITTNPKVLKRTGAGPGTKFYLP